MVVWSKRHRIRYSVLVMKKKEESEDSKNGLLFDSNKNLYSKLPLSFLLQVYICFYTTFLPCLEMYQASRNRVSEDCQYCLKL